MRPGRLWVVGLGVCLLGWAARGENGDVVFVPPVEAVVAAGGEVRIDVRVFVRERGKLLGGRAPELEVGVGAQPRFGVIDGVQQLPRAGDRDGAIVAYRQAGEAAGASDEFGVVVRGAGETAQLATGVVRVRIEAPMLRAEPAGRLRLGACTVGDSIEGFVTLENSGTGPVALQVAAWRPFFVENGNRNVYLGPGARQQVRLTFRPEAPGGCETPLILKPDLLPKYVIEATAIEALSIGTNRLDFGAVGVGASAEQRLRVQNVAQTLRTGIVQISGPFEAEPRSLSLEPAAKADIRVRYVPRLRGEGHGWLVVQEGASSLRCQLEGQAFDGPMLSVTPGPVVDLGTVTGMSASAECGLSVSNRGDMAWTGAVSASRPFSTRLNTLTIEPGGQAAVDVAYHPVSSGSHTQALVLAGPVTASVTLVAGYLAPAPPLATAVPGATSAPPARGQAPAGGAKPPSWRPKVDDNLPLLDLPGLDGRMVGDTEAVIEWELSDEHPVERLLLRQRQFVPVKSGRGDFVWQGWSERPQRAPGGKLAGITLRGLRPFWNHVFAVVETDAEGNVVAQSPLIEVTTGGPVPVEAGPSLWAAAGAIVLGILAAVLWYRTRRERPRYR